MVLLWLGDMQSNFTSEKNIYSERISNMDIPNQY